MTYNLHELPRLNTAGKITVLTAIAGFSVFLLVFLLNVGSNEIQQLQAQSNATTTLTVLNTPPQWVSTTTEEFESSTTTPTNSGSDVSWIGRAVDSNGAPYFMIVCDTDVAPVASSATSTFNLGTKPPTCGAGARTWAVSTATLSGEQARAATTTTESFPPFAEVNDWYAWVCDDDPVNPRCNYATSTGLAATNSSPFHVNRRPTFTVFSDTSPADPGAVVNFYSTSTDPDSVGGEDTLVLHVCNEQDFGTGTSTTECGPGGFVASTSLPGPTSDASAVYTLPPIIQDQDYDAFGYILDEHGHLAINGVQGDNATITVNNVAPTVAGASIELNDGFDMEIDTPAALNYSSTSLGFTLEFITSDANSCDAVGGGNGDEVTDYIISVFRGTVGSSTCDGSALSYDPNNCYPSGVATTTWNLACTAATSSCAGPSTATMDWDCTFPLWHITDPTDAGSYYTDTDYWSAMVIPIDNDGATSTAFSTTTNDVDVVSFAAFDLFNFFIPYGSLEPGQDSGIFTASTTILATGNTGVDQNLSGASMCGTYTTASTCPGSASSTIDANQQQYATSSVSYNDPLAYALSSTSVAQLELNVPKSTSTTVAARRPIYWGINVPGSITLAGDYTGENLFQVVQAEAVDWLP